MIVSWLKQVGGRAAVLAITMLLLPVYAAKAEVPDWPGLYDPFIVHTLNLELVNPGDLNTILRDTTFEIEVPAWFWADGDDVDPILISVRRKSATGIPSDANPQKVSFKLDINAFEDEPGGASLWHGVKKLSLENGDDADVVIEGVAWYLHRVASESALDYQSGLASWVNLVVDGQSMGVYVNVEQPDKQFLKNRGLWEGGDDTWLYKMSDIDSPEIKEAPEDEFGNAIESPASVSLCYAPFVDRNKCSTPADVKAQLENRINMEGMLTYGAVTAFHYSPDDLFAKGKNFYYIDYSDAVGFKREYTQWDLDSAFGSMDPNASIYSQGRGKHDVYEESLVEAGNAPFREEYDAIITYLLDGPFEGAGLLADLQALDTLLAPHLAADANSKGAAGSFSTLAEYVPARIASMLNQLPAGPPSSGTPGEIHVGDLDGSAVAGAQRTWTATVTVALHDYVHVANVEGATVSGSWSGGIVGGTVCVTNGSGQCSFDAVVTKKSLKQVAFSISNASGAGSTYVPGSNHDDEGDSDGNSIAVAKP